jgi:hypothetical protein
MNRPILACGFFVFAAAALGAQDASQSSPYQGTSNPPPNETIITSETTDTPAKPPAGHPMVEQYQQPAAMAPAQPAYRPRANGDGTDEGTVGVASEPGNPGLSARRSAPDPDEDIVHPEPLPPGTLGEGTMVRVRLMDELSSALAEKGQPFRSRVATDVLQDGHVVIPAGAEIDGRVADVSTGHFGGHGSLFLRPETVTLADGSSYKLHAVVRSAPGSNTRVGSEGDIRPGSRVKRDSYEYGGVVGGGVITGAVLGGPVGALAGGIVGAGLVTTHLLVSHPQTNLESGTVLILTLTEQMRLVPSGTQGN